MKDEIVTITIALSALDAEKLVNLPDYLPNHWLLARRDHR